MRFDKINICIVGGGKLGLSFADYFAKHNCNFNLICRSDISFNSAVKIINQNHIFRNISEIEKVPDMIIFAVRDGEIKLTSDIIANRFKSNLYQKYCIHCSGLLNSEELFACKEYGAITLSMHPYQTFYFSKAENFDKIHWGIEGDINEQAIEFIKFMRGYPHRIDKSKKIIYHISAVAMSNYLNTAIALGKLCARSAGISPEEFAPRIINTTVDNVINASEVESNTLTGPIARGDINTVKSHISALKQEVYLLKPYCYFGLGTLELAKSTQVINEDIYQELKELFDNNLQ